jgi:hypothetical protein
MLPLLGVRSSPESSLGCMGVRPVSVGISRLLTYAPLLDPLGTIGDPIYDCASVSVDVDVRTRPGGESVELLRARE